MLFALSLVASFSTGQVRAQSVALDLQACPEIPGEQVRSLLALELPGRLLTEGDAEPEGTERVRVHCTVERAELTRQAASARTLSLVAVPVALRARTLALAIAELLRPEPKPSVSPAPAPAASTVVAPKAQTAASMHSRYRLWAGLEGHALPLLALGGALMFHAQIRPFLAWSSALAFSQVRTAIDQGRLRAQTIALRTGPALSLTFSRIDLLFGAGLRISRLRLAGEASDATTRARAFDTWLFAPTVFGAVSVALGRGALLALELDAGHALRRVRADVQNGGARTLSAFRLSAVLGAGFAW